jgi:uncharacterized protein YjbJ (UPF0337 family)
MGEAHQHDLDQIQGKGEQLVGKIQQRYDRPRRAKPRSTFEQLRSRSDAGAGPGVL